MIGRGLGLYPPGHPAGFLMALLGAVVVLVVYGFLTQPASTRAQGDALIQYTLCRTAIIRPT
jgi:hypothetical protein